MIGCQGVALLSSLSENRVCNPRGIGARLLREVAWPIPPVCSMERLHALSPSEYVNITLRVITESSTKIRKQLLLLFRFMSFTTTNGNLSLQTCDAKELLYRSFYNALSHHADITLGRDNPNYDPFIVTTINEMLSDPLSVGILIAWVCCAPLDPGDQDTTKLESYLKEILVMDRSHGHPDINLEPFFGAYTEPIYPMLLPNPRMASIVHGSIDNWTQEVSSYQAPILPRISAKLLPSFTRREMNTYVHALTEDPELASQASLERLLQLGNVMLEGGGVEMKQRWYTNGPTPRSYFVSGVDGFYRGRFIEKIFKALSENLVITARHNRVNPRRIYVAPHKSALFYDLTSFSSNCAIQRTFLERLAQYTDGISVTVADFGGRYDVNLKDLIMEYNEMNHYPEYVWGGFDSVTPSRHGVAGFLGVNGNISSCTFIHGAFLLQLVEETVEAGCAGDDAVVCVEPDNTDDVWTCVSLIGILALEKTYNLDEGPAVYLKRRTEYSAHGPSLIQRRFFMCPSLVAVMGKDPTLRRSLSRFRESKYSSSEMRTLAAQSLSATFRSARGMPNEHVENLARMLVSYYDMFGFPIDGQVPQFEENTPGAPFIPGLFALGHSDYVRLTIEQNFRGFAWVFPEIDETSVAVPILGGSQLISEGRGDLSYLCKIGVARKKRILDIRMFGESALEKILAQYDGRVRGKALYEFDMDALGAFGTGVVMGIPTYDDGAAFAIETVDL